MTSGGLIKLERENKGLSQKGLGKLLGVSGSLIGQYETDVRSPKIETLRKIAAALEIPLANLIMIPSKEYFLIHPEISYKKTPDGWYHWTEHTSKEDEAALDEIAYAFGLLTRTGKTIAVERIKELTRIPEYQKGMGINE